MKYNISKHVTLIYYCPKCKKWCVDYFDRYIKCPLCGSRDLIHSSTVDPAITIERFLNQDKTVMNDCTRLANDLIKKTKR